MEFEAYMRMLDNSVGFLFSHLLSDTEWLSIFSCFPNQIKGIPKWISIPRPFSENWASKTETRCGSSTGSFIFWLFDWGRRALQKQVISFWIHSYHNHTLTGGLSVFDFPDHSPLRKLLDGRRTLDKNRWINSPNVYQKVEIVEQGTQDPKKITKVVWSSQLLRKSDPKGKSIIKCLKLVEIKIRAKTKKQNNFLVSWFYSLLFPIHWEVRQ